ncbi:MAG: rod shape-determining protein MreD [Clostridia bacterium]
MWQFKWWAWILVFLAAVLLDVSLLPNIFPAGYVPDLVLPLVIAFSFFETPPRGALIGAIGGLLLDISAGRLLGLNMTVYAGVGFFIATIQGKVVRDRVFVPGLIGAGMEAVVRIVEWILVALFGFAVPPVQFFEPLPVFVLFGLFVTPGLMGLMHFRPRHEVDTRLKF